MISQFCKKKVCHLPDKQWHLHETIQNDQPASQLSNTLFFRCCAVYPPKSCLHIIVSHILFSHCQTVNIGKGIAFTFKHEEKQQQVEEEQAP